MLYLLVFVVCLCLALLATRFVRDVANAKGWTEAPTIDRHVHSIPIPRLGGVAIYFSFMSAMLMAVVLPRLFGTAQILPFKPTAGLLGAATMIFLLGLVDDLRSLSPYWKFAVQALAGVWLYASGLSVERIALISHDSTFRWMFSLPLTVFWVLLITNAFNLIDGLDGLAAGSALFSTFVLFVLSLVMPNPLVALLTVALAGATLGFLRFNFHPATIFLGDSGSLFIGFMLAALALTGSQKASTIVAIAIPLLALGLPILDVALAVARRFLTAKPLFGADKHHIHHKLLKLGLSQRETVLILYVVTAAFGFLSLVVLRDRRTIALVLAVIGVGVLIGVQQLRYQEFAEMASALQRFGRRRQLLANHVAIRQATERLSGCDEMGAICAILRDTLEPIGFDGIQLESERNHSLPMAILKPLCIDSSGRLRFSWRGDEIACPTWEIRLEITSNSKERLGHLSLIRSCRDVPVSIDVNVLTNGFQTSLAGAMERVYRRLEAARPARNEGEERRLAVASGSRGD